MIVKFLEIFTEYFSTILCIHKVAGKKIKINWHSLLDFACCIAFIFIGENIRFGKLVLYAYLFIYVRIRVADTWKQTIKSFVVTMCVIPLFQLLIYAIISRKMQEVFSVYFIAITVNTLIIIFFLVWKEKYISVLVNGITKFRKIIFLILLIYLIYRLVLYFLRYKMIESYFMDQMVIFFLSIAIMLILWVNSENEKKHKAEELRTYQLYTSTFEDAIAAIRMKQHEFDNHINAIKCMRYTINNTEELFNEQDKYCEMVLQDNKYNKLLKLKMSPILVGYLYSKFTTASAQGINIEYEMQDVNIESIAINDLIEVIGILFDNAVEALEEQGNKEMETRLLKKDNTFIVMVANVSNWKTNSEIERFFEYGYSTKGRDHGLGLYRINMLLKKYKACIQVENIMKNDMNYLCFKAIFNLKKV